MTTAWTIRLDQWQLAAAVCQVHKTYRGVLHPTGRNCVPSRPSVKAPSRPRRVMKSSPPSAAPSGVPSSAPPEASLIGRFVAIFTPVFAVAAGWFAGVIAQAVPGAHLDQNQIVAF